MYLFLSCNTVLLSNISGMLSNTFYKDDIIYLKLYSNEKSGVNALESMGSRDY